MVLAASGAAISSVIDDAIPNVMEVTATIHPRTIAPAPNVMEVPVMMDPSRTLLAPRVAAVLTAQKTFSALAPLIRTILVPAAVLRVLAWKRNLAFGSPSPSRVTTVTAAVVTPTMER